MIGRVGTGFRFLRTDVVRSQHSSETAPVSGETLEPETVQIILSKLEKLDQLERALTQQYSVTQVSYETPPALPVTSVARQAEMGASDQPVALLPAVTGVSPEEVKSVVDAYLSGIAKRDICSHLRWSSRKYTTIIKPVLDQF